MLSLIGRIIVSLGILLFIVSLIRARVIHFFSELKEYKLLKGIRSARQSFEGEQEDEDAAVVKAEARRLTGRAPKEGYKEKDEEADLFARLRQAEESRAARIKSYDSRSLTTNKEPEEPRLCDAFEATQLLGEFEPTQLLAEQPEQKSGDTEVLQ